MSENHVESTEGASFLKNKINYENIFTEIEAKFLLTAPTQN
jgi:hypothetical protein